MFKDAIRESLKTDDLRPLRFSSHRSFAIINFSFLHRFLLLHFFLLGINESLKKSSSNASSLPSLSTWVVDSHSVPAVVDRIVRAARVRVVVVVCVCHGRVGPRVC